MVIIFSVNWSCSTPAVLLFLMTQNLPPASPPLVGLEFWLLYAGGILNFVLKYLNFALLHSFSFSWPRISPQLPPPHTGWIRILAFVCAGGGCFEFCSKVFVVLSLLRIILRISRLSASNTDGDGSCRWHSGQRCSTQILTAMGAFVSIYWRSSGALP